MDSIENQLKSIKTIKERMKEILSSNGASEGELSSFESYAEVMQELPIDDVSSENSLQQNVQRTLEAIYNPQATSLGTHVLRSNSGIKSVNLPAVLELPNEALRNCSVENVSFDSVETIPYYCFAECKNIKSVTMKNAKTQVEHAFYNCTFDEEATFSFPNLTDAGSNMFYGSTLKKITQDSFPKLTKLGESMFSSCKNLESISFPEVTSVGSYCFSNCTKLPVLNSSVFPKLESIENGAFDLSSNTIEEIDLPLLTDIPAHGLANCFSAKRVNLPNVTRLGFEALWHLNSCIEINLPNLEECYSSASLQGLTVLESISLPKLKVPVYKLFSEARKLQNVDLPLLTYYADYMFERCWDITEHSNLKITSLGSNCYYDCRSLETVNFPEVVSIGSNCFYDCKKLVNVNMPKLESIGDGAFLNCAITEANFPNAKTLGSGCFYGCPIETLNFPEVTKIEGYLFGGSPILKSATFPKLIDMGSAFQDCNQLTNVYLPLVQKCSTAFDGCTSLETVDLPELVHGYASMFRDCTSLKSVNLPKLTDLDREVFENCTSLESVSLPSVTRMYSTSNWSPFNSCTALKSVDLPLVKQLSGFWGCTSLKTLNAPAATEIHDNSFKNCGIEVLDLPSVTTIYYQGITKASKLKSVNLPKAQDLKHYALAYNASLTSVTLPQGQQFENLIFYADSSLEFVDLPAAIKLGVQPNGSHIFRECPKLKKVWIGSSCTTIPATPNSSNELNDNFYGSPQVTVYTDLTQAPEGWDQYWNSIQHVNDDTGISSWIAAPVKWGATHQEFENDSYKAHSIVTFNVLTEGADLTVTYLGTEYKNISSLRVLPNQEVAYKLTKDLCIDLIGTFTPDSTEDHTLDLELHEPQIYKEYSYPFEDIDSTFVDGTNFAVDEESQTIVNGSSSYNVNSGTSYGFIKWSSDVTSRLFVTALVSSESSFDFGGVYIGTQEYKPTQSQAKNKTTDGTGEYLFVQSGANSDFSDYYVDLEPNKEYYINFFYVKDDSGNSGQDRFKISKVVIYQ